MQKLHDWLINEAERLTNSFGLFNKVNKKECKELLDEVKKVYYEDRSKDSLQRVLQSDVAALLHLCRIYNKEQYDINNIDDEGIAKTKYDIVMGAFEDEIIKTGKIGDFYGTVVIPVLIEKEEIALACGAILAVILYDAETIGITLESSFVERFGKFRITQNVTFEECYKTRNTPVLPDDQHQSGGAGNQTENEESDNEDEGNEQPQKKRGRRHIPFEDCVIASNKEEFITKIKNDLADKNRDAAMTILKNYIRNGFINIPSHKAFCDAFPKIKVPETTYNTYMKPIRDELKKK